MREACDIIFELQAAMIVYVLNWIVYALNWISIFCNCYIIDILLGYSERKVSTVVFSGHIWLDGEITLLQQYKEHVT